MSDPIQTPSENSNQPVAQEPAAAAPIAAAPPEGQPSVQPASDPAAAALAAAALPATTDLAAAKPLEGQPAPTIPDAYSIQTPAGVELNSSVIQALTPTFKDLKLSNEAANKLTTTFIEFAASEAKANSQRDMDALMKDPEVGGMNYGRTTARVDAALRAFTEPSFRVLLETKGLANNLEFVRVFERIGRAMTADTSARGSPTGAQELSTADKIYGRRS